MRVQKNSMEVKLDALVGAVKALSLVMGAGVVVGAMYVFSVSGIPLLV